MPRNIAAQTNIRRARKIWKDLSREAVIRLKEIATQHDFSVNAGDLIYLNNGWYVTHTGLLGLPVVLDARAFTFGPFPISVILPYNVGHWATVYKSKTCRGFVGYGDADPSNVSSLVHGAEMRVAETRAVNRALRKAYGIGICSVEEIGSFAEPPQSSRESKKLPPQPSNGNGNYGGPKVRDRLCQIIRQHQLDPDLVKAYATDFCGVKTLRDATREQVENFVTHLADWAEKDRNALLCQLNSYLGQKEGAA